MALKQCETCHYWAADADRRRGDCTYLNVISLPEFLDTYDIDMGTLPDDGETCDVHQEATDG